MGKRNNKMIVVLLALVMVGVFGPVGYILLMKHRAETAWVLKHTDRLRRAVGGDVVLSPDGRTLEPVMNFGVL